MRDLRRILTSKIKEELLDRFPELVAGAWPALESAGGLQGLQALNVDAVNHALDAIEESPDGYPPLPGGLEAIILSLGRPAFFVKNDTFSIEDTPSSSETIASVVTDARQAIERAIPRVGRINLRDHDKPWVGTGWIVEPNVLVTNRHVADLFAARDGEGFAFHEQPNGRRAKAELDTYREHQVDKESIFRLPEVLWIEPHKSGSHDAAFLRISPNNLDGVAQPPKIDLMSDEEFAEIGPDRWVAVIGYPAFSIYNDADDQQRIFQGVYNVKRLQPGQVTMISGGQLMHDATTLGGNSGSVVLDLESGKAVALHFGGYEGETNYAVTAPVVRRLLNEKLGI